MTYSTQWYIRNIHLFCKSGSFSSLHIGNFIPNEDRAGEVNVEIASSGENHAGVRFAEKGTAPEGRVTVLMKRAEVLSINRTALFFKFGMHVISELKIICFRIDPFRDTGLVGNNHQEIALSFCYTTELKNTVDEFTVFNFVDVVLIDTDNTVTIQEQSGVKRFTEDMFFQLALG